MIYTIKIQDKTKKAKSLINMLKALKEDYDFIEITEDFKTMKGKDHENELDRRFEVFSVNDEGKDWEILKKELL